MERGPIPEPIQNRPSLPPGLDVYWQAFLDLTSSRAVGLEVGPIPWVAVHAYAEARGFEGEQRDDLEHHLKAMDGFYLQWRRENRPREANNG